jgi:hypothetical protein
MDGVGGLRLEIVHARRASQRRRGLSTERGVSVTASRAQPVSPQRVRVLAAAQMVEGGLESFWGLIFALSPGGTDGKLGSAPLWPLLSLAGLAVAGLGVLRMVAGGLNMFYRGRRLSIATLLLGLLSGITCLCLPTATALCVFGMAVHHNPAVRHAFRLRRQGASISEIDRMLFESLARPVTGAKLDLAMQVVTQFGSDRTRPPAERLREKDPTLSAAQVDELLAACRQVESFAYDLGGELSSDLLDLEGGVQKLRDRYPALSPATAKEVVWQGRYFWWRDHG